VKKMNNTDLYWRPPSKDVVLAANEIHVWRAPLDVAPSTIQVLQPVLNSEELTRAERFRFAKDRDRYIVGRGVLRMLLASYVQRPPEELSFTYNQYGKPALSSLPEGESLEFNISHSHDLALFAFTSIGPLGVDVEYMREDIDYEQLAQHFFSVQENASLQSLPRTMWRQAFYNCWTRKEAYIKARGEGLAIPLDQFDVSLKPGEPAALLSSRESDVANWTFQELLPGADYGGALAINSHNWQLCCWQWSPS
jgi:4'-phosphopantetheinyl transferase